MKGQKASPSPAATGAQVLVLGERTTSGGLVRRLSKRGYTCALVEDANGAKQAASEQVPEVIIFTGSVPKPTQTLALIRADERLAHVPVVADLSGANAKALGSLDVDDWVHTPEELPARLESALRARRLIERDGVRQRRMESLLEITQAATSSLDLKEILRLAVEKIAKVIHTDRCSVVLVEGSSPRAASVVATMENPGMDPLEIDLAKYPELRRSLETRQPTYVENAARDPLMKEVRPSIAQLGGMSILVTPLVCQEDLLGALFLRLSRAAGAFDRDDQEFAQAVAGAIANSLRNARLHAAITKKRDELESAYVDRYRELSEANKRLKELNRLKDELLAVCSHDMRAPLQVLLGHARLLMDSPLAKDQKDSAETVIRQGKKILELAQSLLDKGRGEQGRVALDARMLDVADLCRTAVAELEILARQRQIQLEAVGNARLPAMVDEIKLHEVLQNLVTNAVEHAPAGGKVSVKFEVLVRPDFDVARVVVQDNGAGLPEEQLHLVFDRYRHGPGGTGLGLAICKEFVELHGGEIWAEMPPEGGTAFVFTLPLAKDLGAAGHRLNAPEQARVLVVEDEPAIAAALEETLRSRYRVELARDGAEGLAKAHALQPDLIVMNIFLPRMDGLDAVVALKSSADTVDIPVILVSAQRNVADKVKALNLGAVDYLSKPFQAMELLNRTERALHLRRTERELARSQKLLKQTGRDALTGMHDRVGLVSRLHQEASRARRYGRALCLATVELATTDKELLHQFGTALRKRLRAPDVIGHFGDGLFVVMLTECSATGGQSALSRLLPTLESPPKLKAPVQCVDVPSGELPDVVLDKLLGPSAT